MNPALKWGRTCRIGLADSEDGIHFTRHPQPVLYPNNDPWKEYEWEKQGFTANSTVANTLVPFQGQWRLYYGAADRCIGLATFNPMAVKPATPVSKSLQETP